jgi:hypothetical protein
MAMNSAVLLAGNFGLITITGGYRVTRETLAKSRRTSYPGSFEMKGNEASPARMYGRIDQSSPRCDLGKAI